MQFNTNYGKPQASLKTRKEGQTLLNFRRKLRRVFFVVVIFVL